MKKSKEEKKRIRLNIRKQKWVRKEISKRTRKKRLSNAQRQIIYTEVWVEANRKF